MITSTEKIFSEYSIIKSTIKAHQSSNCSLENNSEKPIQSQRTYFHFGRTLHCHRSTPYTSLNITIPTT